MILMLWLIGVNDPMAAYVKEVLHVSICTFKLLLRTSLEQITIMLNAFIVFANWNLRNLFFDFGIWSPVKL